MKLATNVFAGPRVDVLGRADLLEHAPAITASTSASVIASTWSWVTKTNVAPSRRWMRLSSRRISPRSCASRFESGSSSRKTAGSRTIARPSATRCRSPPESCIGYRSSSGLEPEHLGRSRHALLDLPRGTRRIRRPKRHVRGDRHVRIERVVLEDERDVAPLRRDVVHRAGRRSGSRRRRSARGPRPARSVVDLPHPDGPTSTANAPSGITHRHVVDDPPVAAEHLRHRRSSSSAIATP